jgi:pilus assembly protein CpaB
MSRRWLAIGGAIVLSALGAFLLITYVQGAEERALEGQEIVSVYVVSEAIAEGATLEEVRDRLELRDLQRDSVAEGAIGSLEDLAGLVAAVDLVEGEQLLLSRFETPTEAAIESRIEVPSTMLQATVALRPERAVGGRLVPGDLVAVVASFEPFDLNAVEPGDPQSLEDALEVIVLLPGETEDGQPTGSVTLKTPNSTHIIIHKVLVTGIQVEELPGEEAGAGPVELAPTGNLRITLAAPAADLERIIFTAEHGLLWLALENPDAPEPITDIITRETVYQ